jgi:uncharacterized protein
VILQEEDGERVLPIWIGPGEASAIAMQLADMKFSRPLTHDLLVSVMGGWAARSSGCSSRGGGEHLLRRADHPPKGERSSRSTPGRRTPSPWRCASDAEIFAQDELLELMQLEIADEEAAPPPGPAPSGSSPLPGVTGGPGAGSTPREGGGSISEGMTPEELEAYLRKLDPEDFGRFTP